MSSHILLSLSSKRERTSNEIVMYGLYLYFLGLSFRNVSRAIEPFLQRSHVAVWEWVQKFNPKQIYLCKRVSAFLIDETMVQIGNTKAWLWVAVEPVDRVVLGVYISRHRNMLVTEHFLLYSLVEKYGRHIVYSDGGSWYPEACTSLNLEHRLHSPYEKSIIERAIEYVKDRIEQFDDCYPCRKFDCNLSHVYNWIQLFVFMHNGIRRSHLKFRLLMYLVGGDTSH